MRTCIKCGGEIKNRNTKFCSDSCKYWFNSIRKDKEKGLPPMRKRNQDWCFVYVNVGNTISQRGQGKRSGRMVMGSMAANVSFSIEELRPFNLNNLDYHFKPKKGYPFIPSHIRLGDGTRLSKEEAETFLINKDTSMYAPHL